MNEKQITKKEKLESKLINLAEFLDDATTYYVSSIIGIVAILTYFAVIISTLVLPIWLAEFLGSNWHICWAFVSIPIGILVAGFVNKNYHK